MSDCKPLQEENDDMRADKKIIINQLRTFMEDEARSCSMDYGCITPLYIYRMLGGVIALQEIEMAMRYIKNGTSPIR